MQIKELIEIWNKEAESYQFEAESQPDYQANYYHLVKCLGNPKGKTILEVGSGTGQSSAYLASKGGDVSLLDISSKAIRFSKKYFKSRKLTARFYVQDAFNMKFKPESFDVVWNGGVLEHFSDREKIIMACNMWRLVKPGGRLLITVPNANDFVFMAAKKILQLRKKWAFGEEDDLTVNRMRKLAKQAGITKFKVYAYNPIVGMWFFPYGREIADLLGMNKLKFHKVCMPFGHVVIFCAQKSV